jgi:catechol-2,3-dioxygenase
MHIQEIVVAVNEADHDAVLRFYAGLGLVVEYDAVQIGRSRLRLIRCDARHAARCKPQHFAINIPENQIEQARAWLTGRVPVLELNGESIFHFDAWNAHAVYFRDPAGSIVELIARHTLENARDEAFSAASWLSISEIGIAADDVLLAAERLQKEYALPFYHTPSESFTALGDEDGLLILVPAGREWYPRTGLPADDGCEGVVFETSLRFEDEDAVRSAVLQSALPESEVQEAFVRSWDAMEAFFSRFSGIGGAFDTQRTLPIVRHLRRAGLEKRLRAGQQLSTFVVSRALRHGLRSDQAALRISASPDGLTWLYYFGGVQIRDTRIAVTHTTVDFTTSPEAEAMILRLLLHPFD